ncbi:MAG: insulinase family protein [Treponema sp.]|nr:insulinase family protein [Treponema sp.]
MNKTKSIQIILCLLVIALFAGCSSIKNASQEPSEALKRYELSNGIPVYIQKDTSNQLVSIVLTISGGVTQLTPEQAGLEMALTRMMTEGSEQYSYEAIQNLEYKTSASVYGSVTSDGSFLNLTCLNYYLDDMLPVLLDGFLHPAYEPEQYTAMMTDYGQRVYSITNDPMALLQQTLHDSLCEGTPYETNASPTEQSLPFITVDAMDDLHKKIVDADRLAVFVVGNCDVKQLLSQFERALGSLPHVHADSSFFALRNRDEITLHDNPVVIPHQNIDGSAVMVQAFAAPAPFTPEYAATDLAGEIYSEVLYQVVREKHGACYTPRAGIGGSRINFGHIQLYRVSDFAHITSYVQEAQTLMSADTIPFAINNDGSFSFTTIEECLEEYKNQYINASYSSQLTYRGVAQSYASSYLAYKDPFIRKQLLTDIQSVTADDIKRAFETYFVQGKKQWFAVAGTDVADKIRF